MANVFKKSTMEYFVSAHTPNYIGADYLINPKVPDCQQIYWKLDGNNIIEMTDEEKSVKYAEIQEYNRLEEIRMLEERLLMLQQ
jgi:hypothetical protein